MPNQVSSSYPDKLLKNSKASESEATGDNTVLLTSSIVIITRNRPAMLQRCLERLRDQPANEILVVDASDDRRTEKIVADCNSIRYVPFCGARHQMPASRNLGIARCTGGIVVFIDDDSLVHPAWLTTLLSHYGDKTVGAVGGRAIDPTEPILPDAEMVGRLLADGTRIDNFNADPGRVLEVDRVRGCNMSFRRDLLVKLGGFDRRYRGSNVNEAADMCLRVKQAGYRILYDPRAAVDHLAAPREAISRDPGTWWTQYYLARNRAYLLLKILGGQRHILYALWVRDLEKALKQSRQASWSGSPWLLAHLLGKVVGSWIALLPRQTGLPTAIRTPRHNSP
ncbi:MAG: glycosyltransferase [Cyanobacteria bacterium NC_groundwater_1444_Ag_S-0.65um_54_12]|nr:glycosyltransferase [Cyanobacteria bacterium NC_groundwater_1444_Ag_S-0.65um_54_12]